MPLRLSRAWTMALAGSTPQHGTKVKDTQITRDGTHHDTGATVCVQCGWSGTLASLVHTPSR